MDREVQKTSGIVEYAYQCRKIHRNNEKVIIWSLFMDNDHNKKKLMDTQSCITLHLTLTTREKCLRVCLQHEIVTYK